MPPERRFLDWSKPALPAVVDSLIAERQSGGFLDLSDLIVVIPGGRAGRRFLELLAEITHGRNAPPRVLTPHYFPEQLYEPKRPFASDLTQHFAWAEALRTSPKSDLQRLVGAPPRDADIAGWLALGRMLAGLHRELAADNHEFQHVAKSQLVLDAEEEDRWLALSRIQQAYHARLDALDLWDIQTARRVAVQHGECRTDATIVLVGMVDMNRILRRMLEQVSDHVVSYVHAPAAMAGLFDEFGSLRAAAWAERAIDVPDSILRFVDAPQDQAAAVAEAVRDLHGARSADEILIGIADQELASPVRSVLEEQGIATRWVGGKTLRDSAPFQLLQAVADQLESDRRPATTALLRHPDVSRWLDSRKLPRDWLLKVDEFIAQRVPRRLGAGLAHDASDRDVRQIAWRIAGWLRPLQGDARPLGEWTDAIAEVLRTIYADRAFDLEQELDRHCSIAFQHILGALDVLADIPDDLMPTTTAAVAIRLALEGIAGELLPPDADPESIEMVGWLELPLDDSPSLVICGFNEGRVPESLSSDQFLPNRLREQLELQDNARRYARDAYALSALRHSRSELTLITGRRNSAGDPLLPSRLLFATDPETIARRIRQMTQPVAARPHQVAEAAESKFGFRIPKPVAPDQPISKIRVTAFRDYLACRYRYYLKHVENLGAVDDRVDELDPLLYGTLLHEVLNRWADGPLVHSTDANAIQATLNDLLTDVVAEKLDPDPLPAVQLQIEQSRLRLEGFANWQAKWAALGWKLWKSEQSAQWKLDLADGRSVVISGRIDRIDRHPETGEWVVFDYKTGDSPDKGPKVAHRANDEWIDLQLPLYRWLAKALEIPSPVKVGYILLPRTPSKVKDHIADWSADELQSADEKIHEVAAGILDGKFDFDLSQEPPDYDDFGPICLEGVFGREAAIHD